MWAPQMTARRVLATPSSILTTTPRCVSSGSASSYSDRKQKKRVKQVAEPELSAADVVKNLTTLLEQGKFVQCATSLKLDKHEKHILFKTINKMLLQRRSAGAAAEATSGEEAEDIDAPKAGETLENDELPETPFVDLASLPSNELCKLPILLSKMGVQDLRMYKNLTDEFINRLVAGKIPFNAAEPAEETPVFSATKTNSPSNRSQQTSISAQKSDYEIFISGIQRIKLDVKGVQHVMRRFAENVSEPSVVKAMSTQGLIYVAESMMNAPGVETVYPISNELHARLTKFNPVAETMLKDTDVLSRLTKLVFIEAGKSCSATFIRGKKLENKIMAVDAVDPETGRKNLQELKLLLGKHFFKQGLAAKTFAEVKPLLPLLRYFSDSAYLIEQENGSEKTIDVEKAIKDLVAHISSLSGTGKDVLWYCRGLDGSVRAEFVKKLFLPEWKANNDTRMDHSIALRWLEMMTGLETDSGIQTEITGIKKRLVQRIQGKQGILPNSMLVSLFLTTEDLEYINRLDCDRLTASDILAIGRVGSTEAFQHFMQWAEQMHEKWTPAQLASLIVLIHNTEPIEMRQKSYSEGFQSKSWQEFVKTTSHDSKDFHATSNDGDEKKGSEQDGNIKKELESVDDDGLPMNIFEQVLYQQIVEAKTLKTVLMDNSVEREQLAAVLTRASCYRSPALYELRKYIVMETLQGKTK